MVLRYFILLLAINSIFHYAVAQGGKYIVNNNESDIQWHAKKVVGSHDGHVIIKSGNLVLADGILTGGSFEIDMTSITCSDIKNQGRNASLVSHLKSDDFFSVDKYPTANLVILKATHTGNNSYNITAKITIKNIAKEIVFVAILNNKDGIIEASADITIDRTEFDIIYRSSSFFKNLGDIAIHDNFDLKIDLVAFSEGKKD
jgi:polyisoprenoid-binding protein YceI